jgi:hypothetical protein
MRAMPEPGRTAIRLRLATTDAAAACLAVYAPFVRDTAISFEAEPPDVAAMAGRIAKTIERTPWVVAEIDGIVRGAIQDKILAKKGYAVAPKSETAAQGGQIVKSKKLKGFFLIATVEAPVYGGGDLTQTVRVTMWTYPDKSLQGEFAPKLTQSGTPKGDIQSENLLIKMCAENAVETFQKVAASL